jgi:predicted enzyme related to lactoylglutathione lyase
MHIRRIVPVIGSSQMERSKAFYTGFIGLQLVMDMEWIMTFASPSNPLAQISIVKKDTAPVSNADITISIETDEIDAMYASAISRGYTIQLPITNEPWDVRRFFVLDPNEVLINLMCHIEPGDQGSSPAA